MAKTHFVIIVFVFILPCLFTPSTSLNRDILKHFRHLQQMKNLIDSHRNSGDDEDTVFIGTGPDTLVERDSCNVSPEQTTSAIHVENLFMDRSPLEIIKYVWPRETFYNRVSSTLDAKGNDLYNLNFCPKTDETSENSICVSNGCFLCSQKDIPDHTELTPSESVLCKNEYEKPPDDPVDSSSTSEDIEQDLKISSVSPTQKAPEGEVSGSDVIEWIKKIVGQSNIYKKEEFNDCSYSLELVKAMKYVEKLWKDHGKPRYYEGKEKYEEVRKELEKKSRDSQVL